VASESGKGLMLSFLSNIIIAREGKPCKIRLISLAIKVKRFKSCNVWIMWNHPQSLWILMLYSVLVLWRKGEKEFVKIEKILKFNANKQL